MESVKFLSERDVLASHASEDGGWTIDFTAAMEHEMVVRGFFPPSVREVIVARLDRLTPNAFALLVAGAVLDQGITFEHLCRVADLEEQDGLPALDGALHSHLLQESQRAGRRTPDGRAVTWAQPLDHAPCAGDRASLHLPGASVRTERGVGEGSGGLYVDARARTRCMPAGNGEHSPQPPGDPGRAVAPQPVKSTEPLEAA